MKKTIFLLISLSLAAAAHASYAQMRLDGLGLLLAFALTVAYGVLVDVALLGRLFQHRAVLVAGIALAAAVIFFFLGQAASSAERAGFFKGAPGGAELVWLVVTSAVFVPFILIAPFAQYLSMRDGRRWPGWITAWMVLQLALVPGFFVLAGTEEYFWKKEYADGLAAGLEPKAGALGGILNLADRRQERIWGTGWTFPWPAQKPAGGYLPRSSAWAAGAAKGVDASALIAANEPLGAPDRAALRTLMERHFLGYAVVNIRAKLIWDALEPGVFSKQLAPNGINEQGVVSEEVIPALLVRLEKYGEARLCPGGRMVDADRALLNQMIRDKVRLYGEARKREADATLRAKQEEAEMSQAPLPYRLAWKAANALGNAAAQPVGVPNWDDYPRRVEQLCARPA